MPIFLFLAFIGVVLSIRAGVCVSGGCRVCSGGGPSIKKADGMLFGSIPIHLVGIAGYILIAIAAAIQMTLALNLLVAGAGLFTIFLIVKGYRVRLDCPFCYAVWWVNAMLVAVAFLP